jgi:hypothetical protein
MKRMGDREEFERCAEIVRGGCWSWFLTLKFPRVVSSKYPAIRCADAEEAFMVWFGEANSAYGRGPGKSPIPYVRVIEKKETGDVLLHVLLNGVPDEMQWFWRHRWWELTSGGAWDRILDSRTEGLIRYLFYKQKCAVEYSISYISTYCEAAKAEE